MKGGDAAGLIAYVTASHDHEGRERGTVIALGGTVPGRGAKELADGFEALAALRPGLNRTVAHLMLRWTAADNPSVDQQAEMARLHAEALGFQHWTAFSHGDHVHVAASRVNSDGSVVSDRWDWKRAETSVRDLERRFGLVEIASSHLLDPDRRDAHRTAPTAGELGAAGRGEPSIRLQLQDAVDAAVGDGATFPTFVDRLHAVGITVVPNVQSTGRIAGLSFELDGMAFKASALGKGYSWQALQRKGVAYEQSEHGTFARELRDGYAGARDHVDHGPREAGSGGDRGNARAGGSPSSAVGDGDSGIDGGIPPHHGDLGALDEAGSSSEHGVSPEDSREEFRDVTKIDVPYDAPGGGHHETGGSGPDGGDREPVQSRSDGDPRRTGGRPSPVCGGGGAGLEAGAAGLDLEVMDGTESADAALRKWSRNMKRAMGKVPTKTKPSITPIEAPSLFRLSTLARVPLGGRDMTLEQVRVQVQALGCERYEIGVLPPRHRRDLRPERIRTWTPEEVLKAVPWLRRMNALDRDIYIRPASHDDGTIPGLVLIDDLKAATLDRLKADGFEPTIWIESSPGNFQAWVRLSQEPLTRDEANAVARELAIRYGGDRAAAAWNQYGRASGFTNRKQSRRTSKGAPFARLRSASRAVAPVGAALLIEIRAALEREAQRQAVRRAFYHRQAVTTFGSVSILECAADAFQRVRARIGTTKPDGSPDESARDFGAARQMIRDGYEDEHVAAAILEASPNLYDRHRNPEDYAKRTIEKARREFPAGRTATGPQPGRRR